jgi:hypothetical protein
MGVLFRLLTVAGLGALGAHLINKERREQAERSEDFEARVAAVEPLDAPPTPADAFASTLEKMLAEARGKGSQYLDVNAGALHREVGGYPGPEARMDTCCTAMRGALKPGDLVLKEPKSGNGATLTMRYHLAG